MITNKVDIVQVYNVPRAVSLFGIGQVLVHKQLDCRGVVIDIDPVYLGSDRWYANFARTSPSKDQPWYKMLVNNVLDEIYVPEQDLVTDASYEQINHPLLGAYFDEFNNGLYVNSTWLLN